MGIKIVDNRKIDMTEDEWAMFDFICRSYDRPNCKGEELFKGLFETDDNGIIIFLRPPSTRHTSMECVFFMQNLMVHQHIRLMHKKVDLLAKELREKVATPDAPK